MTHSKSPRGSSKVGDGKTQTDGGNALEAVGASSAAPRPTLQPELLLRLLDLVEQAAIVTDPDGNIQYWNPFAERLYGWRAEEVLGHSILELMPLQESQEAATAAMARLKTGRGGDGEFLVRHRDGRPMWVHAITTPISDDSGKVLGIVGLSSDITERRLHEQQLRFLVEASVELSASLDYRSTLQRVTELVVPELADWCAIDLVTQDEEIELVGVGHVDPEKIRFAHELREKYPPSLNDPNGMPEVIRSGKPQLVPEIPPELIEQIPDPERRRIVRELNLRSGICVPLRTRERIIGALTLVWSESDRRYSEADLVFAEELARRAAMAVENARLFADARRAEERYRTTFEQAAVGFAQKGLDGKWLRINDRMCEIVGYDRDEMTKVTFHDITHPDDLEAELEQNRRLLAGEIRGYRLDKRYIRKSGETVWTTLTVSLHRDMETREPQYYICVIEDISARKKSETHLHILGEVSRILTSSIAPSEMAQMVADLIVPSFVDWCAVNMLTGPDTIEMAGAAHIDPRLRAKLRTLAHTHPMQLSEEAGTPEVIRSKRSEFRPRLTVEETLADERLKLVHDLGLGSYMIVPVMARGEVLGAVTLARADVRRAFDESDLAFAEELGQRIGMAVDGARSYQKALEAEAQLRQLAETLELRVEERTAELERSNRELDQFAYVASHDLKAPLRAIDNLSSWIEEDVGPLLPETSKEHLAKLRGRVLRMERLLDDLLAYSRAGRVKNPPAVLNVGDLLRSVVELLGIPRGFSIEIDDELAGVRLEHVGLEMVLRNLIGNAVKHHHRADGRVIVRTRDLGEWIEFVVEDDGPGINPLYHKRIFELFQTLHPRDQIEGSGMGLAIVKKLVESQGGTIELESEEGVGSRFRFTWPKLS